MADSEPHQGAGASSGEMSFHKEQPEHFTTTIGDMIQVRSTSQSPLRETVVPDVSTDSEFYSGEETQRAKEGKRLSRAEAKKARRVQIMEKHSKGPTKPMKEIQKTIDHILWDDRLDETEWLIGYEDRHSAELLEKPLVDWKPKGGKLRDQTEEDFIPLSRIQYLRRKSGEEKYWDRVTRTDRVGDLTKERTRT